MDKNIRADLKKAILIPVKTLMKKQEIVQLQMNEVSLGYGACKLNGVRLANLQYMDYVYQAARDIIEFDGDINEWEEYIKNATEKV